MSDQNLIQYLTNCMTLAQEDSLDSFIRQALGMAMQWSHADRGTIIFVSADTPVDMRVSLDSKGNAAAEPESVHIHAVLGQVKEEMKPLIVSHEQAAHVSPEGGQPHKHSMLCIPLLDKMELLGAFTFETEQRDTAFEDVNMDLLEQFARFVVMIIKNARQRADLEARLASRTIGLKEAKNQLYKEVTERKLYEEQLKKLSNTDPLTGLHNRRHFYRLGLAEIRRSKRYQHHLSLIMMDIDHFRKINDTYGHAVGDQILKSVAIFFNNLIREMDVLARYGGEEFMLLLPETSLEPARVAASRLCNNVSQVGFVTNAGEISIQVSAGVSSWSPRTEIDLDELIDRAENALIQAKKSEGKRVFAWEDVEQQ